MHNHLSPRTKALIKEAGIDFGKFESVTVDIDNIDSLIELVVEECRTVLLSLYHRTPLEYCGLLITADEEVVEHFYSQDSGNNQDEPHFTNTDNPIDFPKKD